MKARASVETLAKMQTPGMKPVLDGAFQGMAVIEVAPGDLGKTPSRRRALAREVRIKEMTP